MNRIILFAFLTIALPLWAKAQLQLKGNVKNNNEPVVWANVILSGPDGKTVTGALSKDDGSFELKVKSGSYKLKISFVGFTEWTKEIMLDKDTDLGTVLLKEEGGNLKEVSIVYKKKMVEYKADRLVFNVENSVAATGGTAVNAISAAPGVMVQNNSISMLGKGASRVMIDGRMIELTGQELINYLASIPAEDIKSIEVMTNPPAKYEARGEGGLINIILKKGQMDSWRNSTSLTYDQATYGFATLRNSFLYNKNKLKFSASAGGRLGNQWVSEGLDTYYPKGLWELRTAGKQKQNNASGALNFDYDLSARTTVGVQYLGNYNRPDRNDFTHTNIRNTTNGIDSILKNTGVNALHANSNSYNAHSIFKLDTLGRKLSFDMDFFTYGSGVDNNFAAKTYLPGGKYLNTVQSARNISSQDVRNTSIKVDMEHPLKAINLSYGAKISFINSTAAIQYLNTINGNQVPDPSRSNAFDYKERNQAVYLNGTKNINEQLSLQFGLRLENTQTEGMSQTLNQKNTNNYLKLFPTFYLSWKQNENNSFLFNYGRRINRPSFENLNPFRSYINSSSYSEGNPFLKPSFNDNFDFTYAWKGNLRTNVFFNVTTDGFGVVFTSDPATNQQIISRQNYFREYFYGIGENYTLNIGSWLQSQNLVYLLGSKSKFTNGIDATPHNNLQLYMTSNNTFSLSASTKLQADFFYTSAVKRGLFEVGARSGLNLGIKQSLMNNKLQLSALVNDVFNSAYLKDYASVVNGIKQVYSQNNSSRYFRISLTFNFGNDKISVKDRAFGNEEERKRTSGK